MTERPPWRGGNDRGAPRGPRPDPNTRFVYGMGPVRELLAGSADVKEVYIASERVDRGRAGDPLADVVAAAQARRITVHRADRERLAAMVGDEARHQGVVAVVAGGFRYAQLDVVLAAERTGPGLLVALDGVEDPHNVGAVIRSAYLLGAQAILIPEHRAAHVSPIVAKTSAGASELLPIVMVANLVRALEEIKAAGYWCWAVHASDRSQPMTRLDATASVCLVLGAEGAGVRPLVAKSCDVHALIPMQRSGVGSFNVSVAAAIALYEVDRQRAASA